MERGIRARGLRVTPQRYAILEFLRRSPGHPAAEDIYRAVNRLCPRASRATVYNTMTSLKEAGLIASVSFGDGVFRYDANLEPHHHFVCRSCRTIVDVPAGRLEVKLALRAGHRLEGFDLTMRGVCSNCRNERTGR